MQFLAPLAAFLALTIPVVILLYLLKLKRMRRVVSSTILWRRSVEDLMANAPFQKLRRNLLLYLQILILLLAILAAMRPFLRWAGFADQNLIVLIDRSASMQSTDVGPSRMERAKNDALRLIEDMSRGDRMAVLAFSDHAEVVQPLTDDRNALRRAVDAIEPTDTRTKIDDSLAIAKAIARANKNSEIYILSDGRFNAADLSLDDQQNVSFVSVGERSDNLAIVDLDLREAVGQTDESELFVRLSNFSDRPRRTTLRLLIDGELANAKDVEMAPNASASTIFRNIVATEGQIELRLDSDDDLSLDNVAHGILDLKSAFTILLVSNGNYFLESLLSIHPEFQVSVIRPAAYGPETPAADVTIFDSWAPEQLAPGSYIMLHAAPPLEGVEASTQPLTTPLIVDWHRLHPLTRFVNFEPVNIQTALNLEVPSWSQVLAESIEGPMIVLFDDNNIRCLTVAFSIFDSDWPLHISFPVFLSNAVRWLAAQAGAESRVTYRTGDPVHLSLPENPERVEVRPPDAKQVDVALDEVGEGFFASTSKAGVYEVAAEGETVNRFAVNLLSDEESNTSPVQVLSFQGRLVESSPEQLRQNVEIWFWPALLALVVLMIEWLIYCRRSML